MKLRKTFSVLTVSAIMCACMTSTIFAENNSSSTINPEKTREFSKLIDEVYPRDLEATSLNVNSSSIDSVGEDYFVELPRQRERQMLLNSDRGGEVKISIAANYESASVVKDDIAYYIDRSGNFVSGIRIYDGGLEQNIIINSSDAPESYSIDFDISNGGYLDFAVNSYTGEKDGSIEIRNKNDKIISTLNLPSARDANGVELHTYYSIVGNTLTQTVEHVDEDVQYPVVIQPRVSFTKYFSTDSGWITRDGVVSLSLYPSEYTQSLSALTSLAALNESWGLVKEAFSGSSKWYNTDGMYDQYLCHFYIAALTKKPTYNLEPSRPNVGLAATIAAQCNP